MAFKVAPLYAVPVSPAVRGPGVVVICNGCGAWIVIENCAGGAGGVGAICCGKAESCTCTKKVYVAGYVTPGDSFIGMPVIWPVLAFRARPGGRTPEVMVTVSGVTPPCVWI